MDRGKTIVIRPPRCSSWAISLFLVFLVGPGMVPAAPGQAGEEVRPSPRDQVLPLLGRARTLVEQRDLAGATVLLQDLINRYPNDPRPLASLSHVRYASGDVQGAVEAAAQSLEVYPNPKAWNNLAQIFYDQGIYDQAEAACQQSLVLDASQAEAWLALARVRARRNLLAESARLFRQAAAVSEDKTPILREEALFLLDKGRPKDALKAADELLQTDPEDRVALLAKGRVAYLQGHYEQSKAVLKRCLELGEKSEIAHLFLGETLIAVKELKAAEANLLEASEESGPNASAVHFALSRLYRMEGDGERARVHTEMFRDLHRRDLEEQSQSVPEVLARVSDLIDAGRFVEALEELRPAVARHPDVGRLHLYLGHCLVMSGSPEEAWPHLQRGEALDPLDAPALSNIGAAFLASGSAAMARACWEKSLYVLPAMDAPLMNLARVEYSDSLTYLKGKGAARADLNRLTRVVGLAWGGQISHATDAALPVKPEDSDLFRGLCSFNVALGLAVRGNPEDALARLEAAEKLLGGGAKLTFYRWLLLTRLKRGPEAARLRARLGLTLLEPVFAGAHPPGSGGRDVRAKEEGPATGSDAPTPNGAERGGTEAD